MNVGILFSGGKDSCYALYWASNQGYDVSCLITLLPKKDSYMFHEPNISLAKVQAEAIGMPIIEQKTTPNPKKSKAFFGTENQFDSLVKEIELDDLSRAIEKAVKKYKIEAVILGALASDYQFVRVNRVCEDFGIKVFSPLCHTNQEKMWKDLLIKFMQPRQSFRLSQAQRKDEFKLLSLS